MVSIPTCSRKIGVPPKRWDCKSSPQWVLGFADGEGFFGLSVNAEKKTRNSTYLGVDFSFEISQSTHDLMVLYSLRQFFGKGTFNRKEDPFTMKDAPSGKTIYRLRHPDAVIEFFDAHSLLTDKMLDYVQFKKAFQLKTADLHKTPAGLDNG